MERVDSSSPPLGRRPGNTETRQAILEAARVRFGANGYAATSLRAVARDARVDPALVGHFFGSKAGLFGAAVRWPLDPDETNAYIVAGDRSGVGRRLVEMFIRHWSEAEMRSPIIALINAATTDPAAATLLRDFLLERLLLPMLEALKADHRHLRASLISSQLTGLGLSRYVLGLVDPDEIDDEQIIDAVAPTLQRYCMESLTRS